MMAALHAFTQTEANTRQYCGAPTLPDQSAHQESVPVLAKGPAEPILILLQLEKKKSWPFFARSEFQDKVQNICKHISADLTRDFSAVQ